MKLMINTTGDQQALPEEIETLTKKSIVDIYLEP